MTDSPDSLSTRGVRWLRRSRERAGVGLGARVAALEEEMQETRRLNRRLAELMDIVEELLVPLSQRDEERVRAYLDSHSTVL